jgi:hypothetical protein
MEGTYTRGVYVGRNRKDGGGRDGGIGVEEVWRAIVRMTKAVLAPAINFRDGLKLELIR